MKVNRSDQDGFTIIETLIVLGIAGLIYLITFQAIPAVQRSSQNNERKQDVSNILQGISHYELNNSGNLPNYCGNFGADQPNCAIAVPSLNKLSYYNSVDIIMCYGNSGSCWGWDNLYGLGADPSVNYLSSSIFGNAPSDEVSIGNYGVCATTSLPTGSSLPLVSGQGAGYNNVWAVYLAESGAGSYSWQCQQL